MLSFLALVLAERGVPVGLFFVAATGTMVVSRFTVMAWLGAKPRHAVAGAGLCLMGAGYALLWALPAGSATTLFAAVVFGLGYSTAFPVLSLWATDHHAPERRGRPMAVFTTVFQAGIFLVPLLAGRVGALLGLGEVLIGLAGVALVAGLFVLAAGRAR